MAGALLQAISCNTLNGLTNWLTLDEANRGLWPKTTCMPVHMYACSHVCMFTCMTVHMYAHLHLCAFACMHIRMHACSHACVLACMRVHMYTCSHVCVLTCIHVHMYARSRVCVFTVFNVQQLVKFSGAMQNKHKVYCAVEKKVK